MWAGGFETRLYHVTPRANEASIDAEGLRPQFDWSWDHKWILIPVFVSVDMDLSPDFIADLYDVDEVVVYRVCEAGLTLHPGPDGLGTFSIREWVPPDLLKKDHIYNRTTREVKKI